MSEGATPIPPAALLDWWLGEQPAPDDLEEHLMACGRCAATVESLAAIASGVRRLVRRGRVALALTPALLARLEAHGVRIRHHHVAPGGRTACTASPEDDLVSVCLAGDFRPGERIDVVMADAPVVSKRLEDVPVDRERGRIVLVEPGATICRLPAHTATITVLAVSDDVERTVGTYTLEHRPWGAGG